jgi:hypothetical protein
MTIKTCAIRVAAVLCISASAACSQPPGVGGAAASTTSFYPTAGPPIPMVRRAMVGETGTLF